MHSHHEIKEDQPQGLHSVFFQLIKTEKEKLINSTHPIAKNIYNELEELLKHEKTSTLDKLVSSYNNQTINKLLLQLTLLHPQPNLLSFIIPFFIHHAIILTQQKEKSHTNQFLALLLTDIELAIKNQTTPRVFLQKMLEIFFKNLNANQMLHQLLQGLDALEYVDHIPKTYPNAEIGFVLFAVFKNVIQRLYEFDQIIENENKRIAAETATKNTLFLEQCNAISKLLIEHFVSDKVAYDEALIKKIASNPSAILFLKKYGNSAYFFEFTDNFQKTMLTKIAALKENTTFATALSIFPDNFDPTNYIYHYIESHKNDSPTWWDNLLEESVKQDIQVLLTYLMHTGYLTLDTTLNNMPLVHAAAAYGSVHLMQLLIDSGAQIATSNTAGFTPLIRAVRGNHFEMVQLLLDQSSSNYYINYEDAYKQTALYYAVAAGNLDIAALLIRYHANVNKKNFRGYTILMSAAENGLTELVRLLLSHNCHVNGMDAERYTAVTYAALRGHTEIVKLLLQYHPQINTVDNQGNTPLILAAYYGRAAIIKELLAHKANVFCKDRQNNLPIHIAIQRGHADCVKSLLSHQPFRQLNEVNAVGSLPLHIAITYKQEAIVRILLESGALINLKDAAYDLPIHIAVKLNQTSIIKLLLEFGADLKEFSRSGHTALHIAIQNGDDTLVSFLLDQGIKINEPNSHGTTPLNFAIQKGKNAIGKLLLDRGALANHVDAAGDLPICYAVQWANKEMFTTLLEYNADVNLTDRNKLTALHWAILDCRIEMLDLLLQTPRINLEKNIIISAQAINTFLDLFEPQQRFDALIRRKKMYNASHIVISPLELAEALGNETIIHRLTEAFGRLTATPANQNQTIQSLRITNPHLLFRPATNRGQNNKYKLHVSQERNNHPRTS